MRPDYGCDIHRLVFSKNDDTTAGLAMHAVKTALLRWEPRIELLSVDASPSPEAPSRLDIQVGYRLKSTGQRDTLDYVLSLEGGA